MANTEILDSFILTLADGFEKPGAPGRAGAGGWRSITPASVEERDPLVECLAGLVAESSIERHEVSDLYRLVPAGYARYKDRIAALRTLPR